MRRIIWYFILLFCPAIEAKATESFEGRVRSESVAQKGYLDLGFGGSALSSQLGSVFGAGGRVGGGYAVNDHLLFSLHLGGAVGEDLSSLFTQVRGAAFYTVFGRSRAIQSRVVINDKLAAQVTTSKTSNLQVGLGLEQLFLNSKPQIVSVNGASLIAAFEFRMFSIWWKPEASLSRLVSTDQEFTNISFFLSAVLRQ